MLGPQPGDQLGRYRIDRVVGEGRDGVVYAATDPRLQRTVALTVVPSELADADGFAERFRVAATRLSSLSSPYLAQVHDHEVDGNHAYLVSQYVAGGDLGAWLAEHGPLSRPAALRLAEQVAAGLADAHRHSVVHGDVRPGHVLVRDPDTERAHAWLTGFPLTIGAGTGTVVAGSHLADLRGVGRVLHACLTGVDPGAGAGAPQPGTFDADVEGLLGRLLDDRSSPPVDADTLRAELAALAAGSGEQAPPTAPPTAPRTAPPTSPPMAPTAPPSAPPTLPPAPWPVTSGDGKPRRRGRLVALVAAGVVLAVVAGGVLWKVAGRDDGVPSDDPTTRADTISGDVDGDGLGDVLLDHDNHPQRDTVLVPATEDGAGEAVREPFPEAVVALDALPRLTLADVDGDGKQDRVFTSTAVAVDTLVIDVVRSDGEPWHHEIPYSGTPWGAQDSVQFRYGDMDRDGRADLIVFDPFSTSGIDLFVGPARDGGFDEPEPWYHSDRPHDSVDHRVGDFDGDGHHDVLAVIWSGASAGGGLSTDLALQLITSDGSALADAGDAHTIGLGPYVAKGVRLHGDLDGDGADEPLLIGAEGVATVDLKSGKAAGPALVWEATEENGRWLARTERGAEADWLMSDIDGDGDDDLLVLQPNVKDQARYFTLRRAENGGLGQPESWGALPCASDCDDLIEPVPAAD